MRRGGPAGRAVRAVLGLSLVGGAIAAIGGSTFTALVVVLEFGMPFSREFPGVLMGMLGELAAVLFVFGTLTTGAFAALLDLTGRTISLETLRIVRSTPRDGVSRIED